jgi:glycosyltransferase involved in cell wall biosynthesis
MILSSGIGVYLSNLVPRILEKLPEIEFSLLGNREILEDLPWARKDNVAIIHCNSKIYSVYEQIELVKKIPKFSDLHWSPHYNIPLLFKGKLLVTIHDLNHIIMNRQAIDLHKIFYSRLLFMALAKKANAIICVSKFTEKQLLEKTKARNVCSIYNGIDQSWFDVEKVSRPYPKPFLLFVGNIKPHKNLVNLIKAFEFIKERIPHDLVIIGKGAGLITEDKKALQLAKKLGNRICFSGYVDDAALKQHFVHADALVFPSLHEGFGFPPLEAMACRCPTLVSNTTSLPEVCGDAALYCNPHDPMDIAENIVKLLQNKSQKNDLVTKGLQRAKTFSWEKCALDTSNLISKLLFSGSQN